MTKVDDLARHVLVQSVGRVSARASFVIALAFALPIVGQAAASERGARLDVVTCRGAERIAASDLRAMPAVARAGDAVLLTFRIEVRCVAPVAWRIEIGNRVIASGTQEPPPAPGGIVTVAATWTPPSAGDVAVRATADPENTFGESPAARKNNTIARAMTVIAATDPIRDPQPAPSTPRPPPAPAPDGRGEPGSRETCTAWERRSGARGEGLIAVRRASASASSSFDYVECARRLAVDVAKIHCTDSDRAVFAKKGWFLQPGDLALVAQAVECRSAAPRRSAAVTSARNGAHLIDQGAPLDGLGQVNVEPEAFASFRERMVPVNSRTSGSSSTTRCGAADVLSRSINLRGERLEMPSSRQPPTDRSAHDGEQLLDAEWLSQHRHGVAPEWDVARSGHDGNGDVRERPIRAHPRDELRAVDDRHLEVRQDDARQRLRLLQPSKRFGTVCGARHRKSCRSERGDHGIAKVRIVLDDQNVERAPFGTKLRENGPHLTRPGYAPRRAALPAAGEHPDAPWWQCGEHLLVRGIVADGEHENVSAERPEDLADDRRLADCARPNLDGTTSVAHGEAVALARELEPTEKLRAGALGVVEIGEAIVPSHRCALAFDERAGCNAHGAMHSLRDRRQPTTIPSAR
jgi:hypothetical protein